MSIGTELRQKTSFPFQSNIGRDLEGETRTNQPNDVREEGENRHKMEKGFWEATKMQPTNE
ncbi:hypothetical protein ZHAS_00006474 [Anopheles sinensis]|uniref:Uncharacterized protein n=1 Tax=Anopheles sinensis TaxID=74873 RepID=A0A084VME9_ANOSI|nr:hypothetical protein ZHAS_00006474 [Anopheles sinensis]